MRILGIRFKNLNSLTGEWAIDFTHPDYGSRGIFAITGPTGAGKTTILDAICLGLYGRTPRLDRVTKSGNEIMSRQTGECFAQVLFETQKGRFLAHWSQRRARKKPGGELQPPKHEVADAATGTVLESKITQVAAFIEDATGMDFERFTRSMMLAQGGFSAFLAAAPDDRAPILEQITGTGVYSDISVKVHERRNEERSVLDRLQAEMQGLRVLGDDEERSLRETLDGRLSREKELGNTVGSLRRAAAWREGIMKLERDLAGIVSQERDLVERLHAFRPDEVRLGRSLRALSLEGDYRAVMALTAEQEKEMEERNGLLEMVPEKERAVEDAARVKEAALAAVSEVRARRVHEDELIKEVRRLDTQLGEQKKQLDEKDEALRLAARKDGEYKADVESMTGALLATKAQLEEVRAYQEAHPADGALLVDLTLIAREIALLKEREAEYGKACAGLADAEEVKKTFAAEALKANEHNEQSRQRLEALRNERARLAGEREHLLGGREGGEWREESAALEGKEQALLRTADSIQRIGDNRTSLRDLHTGLADLTKERETAAVAIGRETGRKTSLEKEAADLEVRLSLVNRIRDLEEERKRLQDGAPCPLCGSTDHPYARGNVPEASEVEEALAKSREALKEVSLVLIRLESGRARTEQMILQREKDIAEKVAALGEEEEECLHALTRLGLPASIEEGASHVAGSLSAVRERRAAVARVIALMDGLDRKEKKTGEDMEALRNELDASNIAVQDMRLKLQSAESEYGQWKKARDSLEKEVHSSRARALKDLTPFGITGPGLPDPDAVLRNLTERRSSWQAKVNEKTALEGKIHELAAGIDKEEALQKSLEREIAVREEERERLMKSFQALAAERRERYGDKNPDQEEVLLAQSLDLAEQALGTAGEEHGKRDRELASLKERIDALTAKTGERAEEIRDSRERLHERIGAAGFSGMDDFMESRLPDEERDVLEETRKALAAEEAGLAARRQEKTQALTVESARALSTEPYEKLAEMVAAAESELKETSLQIGSISARLDGNSKEKERLGQMIGAVEARKREFARWDTLHQLIGSADGKKFRNFAQGLTFEIMTAHANRRLREMTDRYVLVRDESEPLELNVIDSYQAGEVRSTKNLSGGESFIVSLALALGLSQMASRRVRVDSLFLDEGFGSLDDDALETALETLAGLKDTGKLIGVISHVPALKERIGTQIQVTPRSGGRSVVSGPGCRRGDEEL